MKRWVLFALLSSVAFASSAAPARASSFCDGQLELRSKASPRQVVFTLRNRHDGDTLLVVTRCRQDLEGKEEVAERTWRVPPKSLFPIFSVSPERAPRCSVVSCRKAED